MLLHFEILDKKRLECFQKLASFRRIGFLAGGTALALQAGHRISVDFDVFTGKKISRSFPLSVRKVFTIKEILVNSEDEFTFLTKDNVKISFIFYPFNFSKYVLKTGDYFPLLSIKGIAITKAYTLNRRASWRDYVDMYYILKSKKTSLRTIIREAKTVYKEMFSEKLFLSQLVYTDDIAAVEMKSIMLITHTASPSDINKFFGKQIEKYTK